ncbi:hypothetical protein ACFY5J_28745 [Peribacillus butanolivorans]|uniref:hypothetical protein n=1 Tax=Peribacillus butanolivorans TaxID=421767 RepID=UPI00368D4D9B
MPKDYTPKPVSINKSIEEGIKINFKFPVSIASTSIKFSESGIWKLQLFLNDESIGNMNVYVTKKKEPNIYYLDDASIKGGITSLGGWKQLLFL